MNRVGTRDNQSNKGSGGTEGWEEGQQWKWTNDYLSGYSTDHNVWGLGADFLKDGARILTVFKTYQEKC